MAGITLKLRYEDGSGDEGGKRFEGAFPFGTTPVDALKTWGVSLDGISAVYVNNVVRPLSAPLDFNAVLRPLPSSTHEGRGVYRATLAFALSMAAEDVFPAERLVIGHSLGNGYYYHFRGGFSPSADDMRRLTDRFAQIVAADLPISYYYLPYEEALALFKEKGQDDTVALLEQRSAIKVPVYECGGKIDSGASTVLLPSTGALSSYALHKYEDGFLLRYPTSATNGGIGAFEDIPKLFSVYNEYKRWGRIVNLHSAGALNRLISERQIEDFIRIAEAYHAKKLFEAASLVYERRDHIRVLLIAGPSSSGKTTTAKRISVQLRMLGLEPLAISLDNYYNPPGMAPLDDEGKPDLEALEALDVPFLNEQLQRLLDGDEVTLPVFDFKTTSRREGQKVRITRRTIVIIEGIHGLNDRLTGSLAPDVKWKLYVSPLTGLNIDDHNRVPTSDNRLIRRMVRDNQFRGITAQKTLSSWYSVRRGELEHIFPYQNGADFIFNSALDYELAVLRFYAEPLLHTVKPSEKEFAESARLLSFLENFTPLLPQMVPGDSILREFIGGSGFKYG